MNLEVSHKHEAGVGAGVGVVKRANIERVEILGRQGSICRRINDTYAV